MHYYEFLKACERWHEKKRQSQDESEERDIILVFAGCRGPYPRRFYEK